MEINVVGMLDIKGTEQIRRVYSVDGLAPTLSTMQGGNRQPKILEPYCINLYKEDGTETSFQDRVYDTEQISPAITTSFRPSYIVAMRGRNPEHPTDRTPGLHTEQRLEPNMDGLCNTITTVQKDNLVMESERIIINDRGFKDKTPQVSVDIVPTLRAETHGNLPKVCVKQATKEGFAECKIGGVADLSYPESKTRRGRVQEGGDVCPTLTAQNNEICRIEIIDDTQGYEKEPRIYKDVAPTLRSQRAGLKCVTKYRIRKLTPRECWRLMGFTDEDFEKAASVNNNTQLYKQAGNSIVVNCLEGIFSNLIGKTDGE